MLLWRPEFELDGINSGSWYHCLVLTNEDISLIVRGVLCEVVCCMEVRPGL